MDTDKLAATPTQQASQFLKSLAHPVRLEVLCLLVDKELKVSDIQSRIPVSQSVLSQHLKILKDECLVETRRESQHIYYRTTDHKALKIINVLHEIYCEQ